MQLSISMLGVLVTLLMIIGLASKNSMGFRRPTAVLLCFWGSNLKAISVRGEHVAQHESKVHHTGGVSGLWRYHIWHITYIKQSLIINFQDFCSWWFLSTGTSAISAWKLELCRQRPFQTIESRDVFLNRRRRSWHYWSAKLCVDEATRVYFWLPNQILSFQTPNFSGWWHKDCTYVALNGAYNEENSSPRAERQFWHWMPANKSLPGTYNIKPRKSVILFRPSWLIYNLHKTILPVLSGILELLKL